MTYPSRTSDDPQERRKWWTDFIGFWLLGLCNNFAYVVMLSAAHDILSEEEAAGTNGTKPIVHTNNSLECNNVSAGAILLADILPALAIKVTAPFFMHYIPYDIRLVVIVMFSAGTLILVGLAKNMALSLTGVAFASISSGFGEITMLQLTSFFSDSTVSAWSSGTGAAGILGSLSYTGLTEIVSPRTAILILLFIPVIQIGSYILVRISGGSLTRKNYETLDDGYKNDKASPSDEPINRSGEPTSRWKLIPPLLKYMIPLTLVYFAEYLINQGLFELVFVKQSSINHKSQYRWYSVCYQLGVFLSRSSLALFKIKHLWILPIIQFVNMGIFLLCIFRFEYIPSIWPIFALVVFEGLIGGGAYVNTFYKISIEIPPENREFSMGVASVGDSFGITAAGFSAIGVHKAICSHFDPY